MMEYEVVDEDGYVMIEISMKNRLIVQDYIGAKEKAESYFKEYLKGLKLQLFDILGVKEWWITDSEGMVIEGAFYDYQKANEILLLLRGMHPTASS